MKCNIEIYFYVSLKWTGGQVSPGYKQAILQHVVCPGYKCAHSQSKPIHIQAQDFNSR